MAKRIDGIQLAEVSTTNQPSIEWSQSEASNIEHQPEQIQYMHNTSNSSKNDFHGDTDNPSWRNHPNLKWGDNQNHWQNNNNSNHSRNTNSQNHSSNNTNQYKKPQNTYQTPHNKSQSYQNNFSTPPFKSQNAHPNAPNNFQQQQSYLIIPPIDHHETRISSHEAALQALTQNTQSLAQTTQGLVKGQETLIKVQERHEATMRNLERQLGQLAKQAKRPTNILPSDTIPNSREECKAVQLRSGEIVGKNTRGFNEEEAKSEEKSTIDNKKDEKASTSKKDKEILKPQQKDKKEGVKPYIPKLPYPQRLHKEARDQ
ncbi:uncharacterized protein LOC107491939 [Arachis duranensis]|uniref:Uncharacterized protein LOC107491939 n=1 Tax=Arachis duranensis TaxID=130453 RepID=A0A6P4DR64_ARADU|nr:uncharacterized protein LOC107491939 [Arachis duranensis]XP_025647712.1 myb-like protein I [Arachis hypogaea]